MSDLNPENGPEHDQAEQQHDQDADPPTPEGADADPNEFDPGAEPASHPDPDPGQDVGP